GAGQAARKEPVGRGDGTRVDVDAADVTVAALQARDLRACIAEAGLAAAHAHEAMKVADLGDGWGQHVAFLRNARVRAPSTACPRLSSAFAMSACSWWLEPDWRTSPK